MNYQHTKVLGFYKQAIHKKLILLIFAVIAIMNSGCGAIPQATIDHGEGIPQAPDYQKTSSWVFQTSAPNKPIDVFYVYPTIYAEDSPANMDIKNADLRAAAEHLIDSQASVYSESANVFAPYYRQMSFAKLNPEEDMYKNQYFQIGYSDVSRAFDYFLKNLSQGRPFILAGHSQGSMVLIQLMREHFQGPDLQNQLVAAYLIGYSITPEDFATYPWMKPATQATDTGIIVSYNTQAPEATGSPVLLPGAFCINPLNWTTDGTPADELSNLGAVFFNKNTGQIEREIPYYAGARVDKDTGALLTSLPEDLDTGAHFPAGVYHIYDYALWYRNLKANVNTRCKHYLENNEK